MSDSGGKILCEQAYAQGKMLDHSSWKLPRGITPSDIDMYIDNDGRLIFAELSSSKKRWTEISQGQWRGYRNIIKGTRHVAILLNHNVPANTQINTRTDIRFCQLLMWNDGFYTSNVYAGSVWVKIVDLWFKDSDKAIRRITHSATHSIDEWLQDFDEGQFEL